MGHSFGTLDQLGEGYGFRKIRKGLGLGAVVVTHDLASYLVPVHADIPEIDAVLTDHGLAHALSGLANRATVPVELRAGMQAPPCRRDGEHGRVANERLGHGRSLRACAEVSIRYSWPGPTGMVTDVPAA